MYIHVNMCIRAHVCVFLRTEQATELLSQWEPIDVEDALRLLSPDFTHAVVREFAVRTLSAAKEEELISYLVQVPVACDLCAAVLSLFYLHSIDMCALCDDMTQAVQGRGKEGNEQCRNTVHAVVQSQG